MKRFALNKISIAKLANLQTIKGGLDTPPENSIRPNECTNPTAIDCTSIDCTSAGAAPCTLTSIQGDLTTDPIGTDPNTVSL